MKSGLNSKDAIMTTDQIKRLFKFHVTETSVSADEYYEGQPTHVTLEENESKQDAIDRLCKLIEEFLKNQTK